MRRANERKQKSLQAGPSAVRTAEILLGLPVTSLSRDQRDDDARDSRKERERSVCPCYLPCPRALMMPHGSLAVTTPPAAAQSAAAVTMTTEAAIEG